MYACHSMYVLPIHVHTQKKNPICQDYKKKHYMPEILKNFKESMSGRVMQEVLINDLSC